MQKPVPPCYEVVLQFGNKFSPFVSHYRLPSFREGFSDWVQDTGHLDIIQSEIALYRMARRKDNAGLHLPSVCTMLRCY